MTISPRLVALLFPFILSPALAADTAAQPEAVPDESAQELEAVTVSGLKDPAFLTYARALKALAAFEQYHQALAPGARARFQLVRNPQKDDPAKTPVALSLVGSEQSADIALAADRSFSIPRDARGVGEEPELVTNRSRSLYRIGPHIVSPGALPNVRRLGDLRLECEMIWSFVKDDIGFLAKTTLTALGGGCRTSLDTWGVPAPGRVSNVTLVYGERREALPAKKILANGFVYAPPVHDKSWPDDTLVEFELAKALE